MTPRQNSSKSPEEGKLENDLLTRALQAQADEEAHDRGLIVERLAWTPQERLEANASFVRFYLSVRPEGPLIADEEGEQPSAYERLRPFTGTVDSDGQQLSQETGKRLRELLEEKRKRVGRSR